MHWSPNELSILLTLYRWHAKIETPNLSKDHNPDSLIDFKMGLEF